MPSYLLLAMQAAGMVTDYFGFQNQKDFMALGQQLNDAALDSSLTANRLEAQNASVTAMQQLRQTMGSQIAVMAARGTSMGAGSAASLLNTDYGNFAQDERIRRLNAMGRENQLRAGAAMNRLQYSSDVSKLWQGFAGRTLNTLSSSPAVYKQAASDFSQGFGLTSKVGA